MRKFLPTPSELYHVFNRGTEKRTIFENQRDYQRFIVNMVLFNSELEPPRNISRYGINPACQKIPTDPLVKIHTFTLLPNHFHLELEQTATSGIAKFMHKLEMGYSHFFNLRHSRSGNLFQGQYKMVMGDTDAYYLYLPLYIHLNPLELLPSERYWKEAGVQNKDESIRFISNYPWSGLQEYLRAGTFPFLSHDVIDRLYPSATDWIQAIREWLPDNSSNFQF